ncbi:MAG: MEDS domain-containing protein [Bryobacterales bacterium]|nr:MEDS domain-containing protein [Bryobacterales bacterium]MBV9399985.1 MEDS domain-containing protein [Bryobacterales bacterium]
MDIVRHQCLVYEGSPAKHLRGLAAVTIAKLKDNNRCLYLNSPPMVAGMRSYLAAAGLDVAEAVRQGALVLSSSQNHIVNGAFDVDNMLDMLEAAVKQALKDGYRGLWATGDMTWELGPKNGLGNLIAYECGLEDLFHQYPSLSGICQYHIDTLPPSAVDKALRTHRSVYINEMLSRLNPFYGVDDAPAPVESADTHKEMVGWLRAQEC